MALAFINNNIQPRNNFNCSVFPVRGLVRVDNCTSAQDFPSIVEDDGDDEDDDDRLDFDVSRRPIVI